MANKTFQTALFFPFLVLEEWDSYATLLRKNHVANKTLFLDIRGNHDAFNVPHVEHPDNLHR
jgi:hypothetical protein